MSKYFDTKMTKNLEIQKKWGNGISVYILEPYLRPISYDLHLF